MTRSARLSTLLILITALAGCAVPKTAKYQEAHKACDLVTKELELDIQLPNGPGPILPCEKDNCEARAMGYVSAGALALAVSGSVVLVGNTPHWLEKEGSCDDSTSHSLVNHFTEELVGLGGILVSSVSSLGELFATEQHSGPAE